MKKLTLLLTLLTLPLLAEGTYIQVKSRLSVESCSERIAQAIKEKEDFSVFTIVDHKKNAANVELNMPETKLIIFGNPKAGTMLMKANPMMAYELPLKILVADNKGKTIISYRNPKWLANNYGLYKSPIIPKMTKVMKFFSSQCR